MDLICYLHDIWKPVIRPASSRREWMDETADSFAYRCLPLNVANAHGWEILSRIGCEARWDGGSRTDAITIRIDDGAPDISHRRRFSGKAFSPFTSKGCFARRLTGNYGSVDRPTIISMGSRRLTVWSRRIARPSPSR